VVEHKAKERVTEDHGMVGMRRDVVDVLMRLPVP
jgi:hypothetical protein